MCVSLYSYLTKHIPACVSFSVSILSPSVFSPPDALDCAFKRLDADISLEAQVPLSNDLMKSTAIQVIG